MFVFRWLSTFLAFPVAGFIAIESLGGADHPLIAACGGLIVGAAVGAAQWLALRSQGVRPAWILGTTLGMAIGGGTAVAVTGAATTIPALVTTGLVTGAVVGAVQGGLLRQGSAVAVLWAATVSGSWGLGWLVTANVIVDAERGFYAFGTSGALVATLASGLVLRLVLRRTTPAVRPATAVIAVGARP